MITFYFAKRIVFHYGNLLIMVSLFSFFFFSFHRLSKTSQITKDTTIFSAVSGIYKEKESESESEKLYCQVRFYTYKEFVVVMLVHASNNY